MLFFWTIYMKCYWCCFWFSSHKNKEHRIIRSRYTLQFFNICFFEWHRFSCRSFDVEKPWATYMKCFFCLSSHKKKQITPYYTVQIYFTIFEYLFFSMASIFMLIILIGKNYGQLIWHALDVVPLTKNNFLIFILKKSKNTVFLIKSCFFVCRTKK